MADISALLGGFTPSTTAGRKNESWRRGICECCGSDFTDSVVADKAGWGITLSITDKPEELPKDVPDYIFDQVEIDGVWFNLKLRQA